MAHDDKRLTMICRNCGSNNVTRDALATWSVDEQRWVLRSLLDDVTCEACERETRLVEVELQPAQA